MAGRVRIIGWSGVMILLLLVGTWAGFLYRESGRAFDIGDFSQVNIPAAEEAFRSGGSNEALVLLVKALCFRREALGERGWEGKLLAYGRELYARARNETVDLQTVDDEKTMLQVLAVLRDVGAHR